jgi:hypothetical protein
MVLHGITAGLGAHEGSSEKGHKQPVKQPGGKVPNHYRCRLTVIMGGYISAILHHLTSSRAVCMFGVQIATRMFFRAKYVYQSTKFSGKSRIHRHFLTNEKPASGHIQWIVAWLHGKRHGTGFSQSFAI